MNNGTPSATPSSHLLLRTVIFSLIIACFTAYLAFPSAIFACAVLVLFLICAYKLSNNNSIFVGIFAVCGVLFSIMPLTLLATLVCLVASVAGGAMLCSYKKSAAVYPILTAAVFALSLALTNSLDSALAVITPMPAAIVLAVCSKKKAPRVTAICALSVALLTTALLPLAFSVYTEYGTDLTAFINAAREGYANAVVDSFAGISEASGVDLSEIISETNLRIIAESIFPLAPSFIVSVANLIAFGATFLLAIIRNSLGEPMTRGESVFRLSSASAWLYIISLIAILIGFGDSHAARIFALTMGNLNVILTPAFALVGAAAFISAKKRGVAGRGIFRIILVIIAFMYCGVLILYPIALFGVITTLKLNKISNGAKDN